MKQTSQHLCVRISILVISTAMAIGTAACNKSHDSPASNGAGGPSEASGLLGSPASGVMSNPASGLMGAGSNKQ